MNAHYWMHMRKSNWLHTQTKSKIIMMHSNEKKILTHKWSPLNLNFRRFFFFLFYKNVITFIERTDKGKQHHHINLLNSSLEIRHNFFFHNYCRSIFFFYMNFFFRYKLQASHICSIPYKWHPTREEEKKRASMQFLECE